MRFPRLKPVNHTQEIKGELRLSLIMRKEVKKRKKWFGGWPATPFSTMDFWMQAREGIHWISVASLPSEKITKGLGPLSSEATPCWSCCCKQINPSGPQIFFPWVDTLDLQSNLKRSASCISASAYLFIYFNLKEDLVILGSWGSISLSWAKNSSEQEWSRDSVTDGTPQNWPPTRVWLPASLGPLPLLCHRHSSTSLGCFLSLQHSSLPWVETIRYKPEGETMGLGL